MFPRSTVVLALGSFAMVGGLAACSQAEPEPDRSAGAEATQSANPSAASATPDPTVSPSASTTASAALDPFCAPAQAGARAMNDLLDASDRKSAQTGIEDDRGDVALMNAAGKDMQTASASVHAEWTTAQGLLLDTVVSDVDSSTTADDADAAFDDVLRYLDELVDPEADIAATAGSIAEYDMATVTLLTSHDVVSTASAGAQGLSVVLSYTLDRCGELEGFES